MLTRLVLLLCFLALAQHSAQAETCARSDFVAVVDDAGAALRQLNADNKPAFQERLRVLREKKGWDHDTFIREAEPFVVDEQIESFDVRSQQLLSDIANLGEEGSAAASPDCGLLLKLRERMSELVKAQSAKWHYMFEKLNGAIEAP